MKIGQQHAELFWAKVRVGAPDVCWEWTRYCIGNGYGRLTINRENVLAHRAAWMLTHGPIPDGLHVCHKCDNRKCCNPYHLFLGTRSDNMADCENKGRANRPSNQGHLHGMSKLTEDAVRAIRSDPRKQKDVAAEHGIDQSTVSLIRRRKIWAHI